MKYDTPNKEKQMNNTLPNTEFTGFVNYQHFPSLWEDFSWDRLSITHTSACGVFSLHHALLFLGHAANLEFVKQLHPDRWSLVEKGLVIKEVETLVRKAGAKSNVCVTHSIARLKSWIDKQLGLGFPVILGSNPNIHWICIGGKSSENSYIKADSGLKVPLGEITWQELESWVVYHQYTGEKDDYAYEAISVQPGRGMPASRSIVPWVGGIWKIWKDDPAYAQDWNNLLTDMLEVFWDADLCPEGIPSAEFLTKHLHHIVEGLASVSPFPKKFLSNIALMYRDVSDFHSLVVDPDFETETATRFSYALIQKCYLL